MKVIKFRSWDSLHKVYRDHQDPHTIQAVVFGNDYGGRVIVEQFTGLLDKNGMEIYEGDIVATFFDKHEVVRSQHGYEFFLLSVKEYEDGRATTRFHYLQHDIAIIGNIHLNQPNGGDHENHK